MCQQFDKQSNTPNKSKEHLRKHLESDWFALGQVQLCHTIVQQGYVATCGIRSLLTLHPFVAVFYGSCSKKNPLRSQIQVSHSIIQHCCMSYSVMLALMSVRLLIEIEETNTSVSTKAHELFLTYLGLQYEVLSYSCVAEICFLTIHDVVMWLWLFSSRVG